MVNQRSNHKLFKNVTHASEIEVRERLNSKKERKREENI